MEEFERIHKNGTILNEDGLVKSTPIEDVFKNHSIEIEKDEEQRILDHFAGLAMQGFISHYGNEGSYPTLSQMSYEVAKEMLRARKEVTNDIS